MYEVERITKEGYPDLRVTYYDNKCWFLGTDLKRLTNDKNFYNRVPRRNIMKISGKKDFKKKVFKDFWREIDKPYYLGGERLLIDYSCTIEALKGYYELKEYLKWLLKEGITSLSFYPEIREKIETKEQRYEYVLDPDKESSLCFTVFAYYKEREEFENDLRFSRFDLKTNYSLNNFEKFTSGIPISSRFISFYLNKSIEEINQLVEVFLENHPEEQDKIISSSYAADGLFFLSDHSCKEYILSKDVICKFLKTCKDISKDNINKVIKRFELEPKGMYSRFKSSFEKELINSLESKNNTEKYRFDTLKKIKINNKEYILDYFFPEYNLMIEYNEKTEPIPLNELDYPYLILDYEDTDKENVSKIINLIEKIKTKSIGDDE